MMEEDHPDVLEEFACQLVCHRISTCVYFLDSFCSRDVFNRLKHLIPDEMTSCEVSEGQGFLGSRVDTRR